MIVLKHRSLLYSLAVATLCTGLANLVLFFFNRELHSAVVGSICMLLGFGYLMMLAVFSGRK